MECRQKQQQADQGQDSAVDLSSSYHRGIGPDLPDIIGDPQCPRPGSGNYLAGQMVHPGRHNSIEHVVGEVAFHVQCAGTAAEPAPVGDLEQPEFGNVQQAGRLHNFLFAVFRIQVHGETLHIQLGDKTISPDFEVYIIAGDEG